MANLSPRQAADLILTGEGYFFFLRGNAPGKGLWTAVLMDLVATENPDLSVIKIGSNRNGLELPGDSLNTLLHLRSDGVICTSGRLTWREERIARGIAIAAGLRFVIVDDFISEEDQLLPVLPITAASPLLPKAIIVDLDGTLANSAHRSPFNASFDDIQRDTVNIHIKEIVQMYAHRDHKIFFVSARGAYAGEREATNTWLLTLLRTCLPVKNRCRLFTREVEDYRPDTVFKLEVFNNHIRDKFDVRLVLDDRPRVCRLWSKLGLPVLCNIDWEKGEF